MTDTNLPEEKTPVDPTPAAEPTPSEETAEPTPATDAPVEPEEPENDAPIDPSDLASYKGKYVAFERIKSVVKDVDNVQNLVLFKSGATIRLPDVLLKVMATAKPAETKGMQLSPNALKMMTIVDAVEVLLRTVYFLNVGEVEKFCSYLGTVVENNYSLATRLLWEGKNKYKLPMTAVDEVLKTHADKAADLQKELNAEAIANAQIQRNRNV